MVKPFSLGIHLHFSLLLRARLRHLCRLTIELNDAEIKVFPSLYLTFNKVQQHTK